MRNLFILLLLTLSVVAAPVPKSVKKDPRPLNGEWVIVGWYIDETKMDLADEIRWTIEDDQLSVRGTKQEVPVGFASNATRTVAKPEHGAPDAIDYTITYSDGSAPSHRPAVFALDRDKFSICMTNTHNGARPAECKPTQGTIMYELKRPDATK